MEEKLKKFVNTPQDAVRELLEGLVDTDADLAILERENVVLRADIPENPKDRGVAIISGGGSGHEPAHAGFVGRGMLSAAVAGDVFTSPSVDAVLAAIRAAGGPAGALLIVKNYTGDRLNFGLAAELAKAEGIPTEIVFVADDVALREMLPANRRRGLAGTLLIHKIAGAAAAEGASLDEIVRVARSAAEDVVTMGVGFGSCIVPTAGKPSFELGAREIELGLGIHGEKGVRRSELKAADAIVDEMLAFLLAERPADGRPLGLLINGLGGTPPMELLIVARRAVEALRAAGHEVQLSWSGTLMSALEMPGCSITMLPLDDERTCLLEAPSTAKAWPQAARAAAERQVRQAPADVAAPAAAPGPDAPQLRKAANAVAETLEANETKLTELDAATGDGDLGASMLRGAGALRALPDAAFISSADFLRQAGESLRRAIAGSSGPFYATALMRAAHRLPDGAVPEATDWAAALGEASAAVSDIGGATQGDRTMVDALAPAAEAFRGAVESGATAREALSSAAAAATKGARATADMRPKFGRAAYLGERAVGHPDGGAVAIGLWLSALSAAFPAETGVR